MGLGKTAQSISTLEFQRQLCDIPGPFLIVAPLTTLGHWQREVETWTSMVGLHCPVSHGRAGHCAMLPCAVLCYAVLHAGLHSLCISVRTGRHARCTHYIWWATIALYLMAELVTALCCAVCCAVLHAGLHSLCIVSHDRQTCKIQKRYSVEPPDRLSLSMIHDDQQLM